jgi:hypothetical protein
MCTIYTLVHLADDIILRDFQNADLLKCMHPSSPGFSRDLLEGTFEFSDESFKFMKKVFVWV